VDDRRIFQIR